MDYDNSIFTSLLLLFFTVAVALLLLEQLFTPNHAPNESPKLARRVPFVGHLLGLFQHGTQYFTATR